jgi:hypothetical protein
MAVQAPRHSARRVNRAQTVPRAKRDLPTDELPEPLSLASPADRPGPIAPYASTDVRPGSRVSARFGGKTSETPAARQAGGAMIAGIVIVASLVAGLCLPAVVGWFNPTTTASIADDVASFPASSSTASSAAEPARKGEHSPSSTATPTSPFEPDSANADRPSPPAPVLAEPTSEGVGAAITLSIQTRHTLPGAPITVTVSGSKAGHVVEVGIIVGGRPQWLTNQLVGADGSTSALVTIPDNLIGRYSLTGLDTVTGILSVPIPIIISAGGGVAQATTGSSMAVTPNDDPTTPATTAPTPTDQDSGAGLAAVGAGGPGGGSGPSIGSGFGIIAWLLVLFVPVAAAIVRFNGRRRRQWRPSRLGLQRLT